MNYTSVFNTLRNAGFSMSNKCHFDGVEYHDFNSRKRDASVSLIIDQPTGAVERVEVTNRKWNDKTRRYEPTKQILTGLQEVINNFAPRVAISL